MPALQLKAKSSEGGRVKTSSKSLDRCMSGESSPCPGLPGSSPEARLDRVVCGFVEGILCRAEETARRVRAAALRERKVLSALPLPEQLDRLRKIAERAAAKSS